MNNDRPAAMTTVQSKSQLGKIRKLLFGVLCSCVFTALPLSARVHYAYVT
jgi:hypothetical protein